MNMEKHRAIPEGYMKVGELAKKAGVSVRTLQYYDKEGLLSPAGSSEGGFRLYTDQDVAKLAQILLLKQLGFRLADIKSQLTSLDTPSDVVQVLTEHTKEIRTKIQLLTESLDQIEALKEEIAQMDAVDFKKFSAILMNLQLKNQHYRLVKHFDADDLEKLSKNMTRERAEAIIETANRLFREAQKLQKEKVPPESERGQSFAKEFWEVTMESVGGDMDLLKKMEKASAAASSDEDRLVRQFLEPAIEIYLSNLYDGAEGETQSD